MLILQIRFFISFISFYWFLFLYFFFHFLILLYFLNVKYGETPLYVAAQNGDKQIVQILLEKGKPNVDLPDQVLLLFLFLFFFSLSHFSIFFINVKKGRTPLYIAAKEGYEQIVQLLLEKGNPNVDLPDQVLLCIDFIDLVSFFFQFLIFLFIFHVKNGATPLYIAAFKGHKQIVQILLEKGNPNVNLADEVILLIVFLFLFLFRFFFQFLIFFHSCFLFFNSKVWSNSSFCCCSTWI